MKPIEISNLLLGGIAESDHLGQNNSFGGLVGLDIHGEPGTFRVNQKLVKDSGATIDEFVKDIVECSNGDLYFFSADSGKIWEKDVSAGTYSLVDTTTPTDGEAKCLGALEYGGYIYWATQNWVHRVAVSKVSTWSTSSEENWKPLHSLDDSTVTRTPVAYRFNGMDQYIETDAHSIGLSNANIFSFACWFKFDGDGATDRGIIYHGGTGEFGVFVGQITAVDNSRYAIRIYEGDVGMIAYSNNDVFESGRWYHLVVTRNGTGTGNTKAYLNGVELALNEDNPALSYADASQARYIGSNAVNYFTGYIGRMSFFDGVLTSTQVLDLYNGVYKGGSSLSELWVQTNIAEDDAWTYHYSIKPEFVSDMVYDDGELIYPHFYPIPTAIREEESQKKVVYGVQSPISRVEVYIPEKGAADLTLVAHDESDTQLATVTVVNANLTEGAWNSFDFTDFNLEYGQKIHFHLTASTSGAYMLARNYTGFADAKVMVYSEGSSVAHPMQIVNRDLYIGDRNLVHKVTRNTGDGIHYFISRALDLPQPYQISCLAQSNNKLLIGAGVGDDIHKSAVFLWDTWSVSFNSSDTIEEDGINAFMPSDNYVYINAGTQGNIYYHDGYYLRKVQQIKGDYYPVSGNGVGVKVNRSACAYYKGMPFFGLSNVNGNPARLGVYSFGSRRDSYPTVLNLEYPLSPRSSGEFVLTNLEIGAVVANSGKLYVSWRHDTDGAGTYAYGVDVLDLSTKLEHGYLETRYISQDKELKKELNEWVVGWKSLPSNTYLRLYFDENYAGYGNAETMVTDANWSRSTLMHSSKWATLRIKLLLETNANDSPVVESLRFTGRK